MTNFVPGQELTADELNNAFGGKLDAPLTPSLVPGVGGVAISGTPSVGQVPTATSPSSATWQSPQGSGIPITGVPSSGWIPVATGSATAAWFATIPSGAVTGVNGVTIGGTPQAGYVPTASSSTSATWGPVPGIPATGTPSIGWIAVATGPTTAAWSATIPTSAVTGFDGVTVTGSAAAGQALIATSPSAATWQNIPGLQPSGTPSNGWVIVATGASTSVWNPPAALTSANDTNVTVTLGGTPTTALLNAASITIGWTGTLAAGRLNSNVVQAVVNDTNITAAIVAQTMTLAWAGTLAVPRGGTGVGSFTANGLLYGNGTGAIQVLAPNATATREFLAQSSSGAPTLTTLTAGDVPGFDGVTVTGTPSVGQVPVATSSTAATWQVSGVRLQRSVTATPIVVASNDQVLNCNINTAAACTLPSAASRNGLALTFKDLGQATTHNITITAAGGETIDALSSFPITNNFQAVTFVPFNDGVNNGWSIE